MVIKYGLCLSQCVEHLVRHSRRKGKRKEGGEKEERREPWRKRNLIKEITDIAAKAEMKASWCLQPSESAAVTSGGEQDVFVHLDSLMHSRVVTMTLLKATKCWRGLSPSSCDLTNFTFFFFFLPFLLEQIQLMFWFPFPHWALYSRCWTCWALCTRRWTSQASTSRWTAGIPSASSQVLKWKTKIKFYYDSSHMCNMHLALFDLSPFSITQHLTS